MDSVVVAKAASGSLGGAQCRIGCVDALFSQVGKLGKNFSISRAQK